MTRRGVLNITTRKKQDNMVSRVVNPDGTSTLGDFSSSDPMMSLFIPNARSTRTPVNNPAVRNTTNTFAVGYKERVQIDLSGGGTLKWRRIVFMMKGSVLRDAMDTDDTGGILNQLFWQTTEGGTNRVIGPLDPGSPSQVELTSFLFQGQQDIDWRNFFTAKVDTTRVTLKYDKVRTIAPGNESGVSRSYRFWNPIRRTILYDDDMESDVVGDKPFSTEGLIGVGDMYILDVFAIVVPPLTGDGLYTFSPEGTYYWHER